MTVRNAPECPITIYVAVPIRENKCQHTTSVRHTDRFLTVAARNLNRDRQETLALALRKLSSSRRAKISSSLSVGAQP